MQNIQAFKDYLLETRRIVITTHHKPDADALGSSLGLANVLKKLGHTVHVITPTDYPKFLHWMPGNDEVIIFNEGNEAQSSDLLDQAQLIFCLDFSELSRINELGVLVGEAQCPKVMIDHHRDPDRFADFELWSTDAAATCELIYDLFQMTNWEDMIDEDVANCLYAGIMTDTGSFRHPTTTAKVHLIIADLISHGANITRISKLIYDNNSLNRLKFIGFALSERLEVNWEYKVAYFAISAKDLGKFESRTGDTEGLVNYALSIEGIVVAATIIEREDGVKLSFRSIGDFPVNEFAKEHFQGGGHKNASGGKSDASLEETVEKFISLLPEYGKKIKSVSAV